MLAGLAITSVIEANMMGISLYFRKESGRPAVSFLSSDVEDDVEEAARITAANCRKYAKYAQYIDTWLILCARSGRRVPSGIGVAMSVYGASSP